MFLASGFNIQAYFKQKEISGRGKEGLPWRRAASLNDNLVPPDGKWHKVSIPLKTFNDAGACSDIEKKWHDSEGLFSWKKVNCLVFDFGEKGLQKDLSIRNVSLR